MLGIEALFTQVWREAESMPSTFSVVALDIDFLIRYCLKFSTDVCDQIMENIRAFILKEFSGNRVIFYPGLDEFFVLLDDTDKESAFQRTQEVLLRFHKQRFLSFLGNPYNSVRITFSAGIAMCPRDGLAQDAAKKAYVSLLWAKAMRRNNVQAYVDRPQISPQRKLLFPDLSVTPVLGQWGTAGRVAERVDRSHALLWEPQAIAAQDNIIYIADQNNHQIIAFDGQNVWPILGDGLYGLTSQNRLNKPTGLCVDHGRLYITDTGNDVVVAHDVLGGTTEVLCGTGRAGYAGDGGPAVEACLNKPGGVVLDEHGCIYVNDIANNCIRKLDRAGLITTFAGNGDFGYSGDDGRAEEASFNEIYGICIDHGGQNIYLADYWNHRIRKINIRTGIITTAVGCGDSGYTGDGGSPRLARLNRPVALCVDQWNNLYIAESGNHCIRVVDWRSDRIYTLLGGGIMGTGREGIEGVDAFLLANPNALCVLHNDLVVLDGANNRLLKTDTARFWYECLSS